MKLTANPTLLCSANVDVLINRKYGEHCMHFKFKEQFNKEASSLATKAWTDQFEKDPDTTFTHIWDCTRMKEFDYDAKDAWLQTLSKYSARIEHIYVVSDSILFRGAARVMSKLSKLNLEACKSFEEMEANLILAC